MKTRMAALTLGLSLAGCAPATINGTMTNPAKSKDKLESMQEYDIGPYKENHRYYVTVKDWSPTELGVQVKIAEIGDCALAKSYSYTLIDDLGKAHVMQATGEPAVTTEKGAGSATLTVSTFGGRFDVPVGADSKAVLIQQRPQPGTSCPALDFRWQFQ